MPANERRERALARGIRPSHIDTHMGTLYARVDYTRAYLKVAAEYRIPAMVIELTPGVVTKFKKQGYPITDESIREVAAYPLPKLDDFHAAPAGKTYGDKRQRFFGQLRLRPPLEIEGASVSINRYFLNHPEMVLGRWSRQDTLYGGEGYSLRSNGDLAARLREVAVLQGPW